MTWSLSRYAPLSTHLPGLMLVSAVGALCCASVVLAQPMLDPKQMSGIPRPVTDLPDRAVSVRVIRGDLSNNVPNLPVELHVGDRVQTAKTDENGRAQFDNLPPGAAIKAVAVVDGETLSSEEFPAPDRGGIRLILVATDREKATRDAAAASAPPVAGQVVIGGESRIVIENDEESVRVFYLLDIMNTARTPVSLSEPFSFDAPTGAMGTAVIEGSSTKARVSGTRVLVEGPFPSGSTIVQIGFTMRAPGGSVEFSQRLPAAFERPVVMAEKAGDARLTSENITQQQDMNARGMSYVIGIGGALPAGQPLVLSLTGLPHHSSYPRWIALSLAGLVVAVGLLTWRRRPDPREQGSERKRLIARREKLFQDLVSLEHDHRRGRVGATRYTSRREELVAALEQVYGALDSDDRSPEPADRTGLAA